MIQSQMTRASVQIEARRESSKHVRPLIQKSVRSHRSPQHSEASASSHSVFAILLNVFARQ
jgi:hypothetical protein